MISLLDITKVGPTVGVWTLVIIAIITLFKTLPQLRKIAAESDDSLRGDLMKRLATQEARTTALEEKNAEDRAKCDADMREIRAKHEAEIQLLRHRLNNERQALDALLMLLEVAPERLAENITRIKEIRETKAREVALEQGAMAGAHMAGKEAAL